MLCIIINHSSLGWQATHTGITGDPKLSEGILYEYLELFVNWSEYLRISINIGISKSHSSLGRRATYTGITGDPKLSEGIQNNFQTPSEGIQYYIHPQCHHDMGSKIIIIFLLLSLQIISLYGSEPPTPASQGIQNYSQSLDSLSILRNI